jgi:hypothetical protein
VELEANFPTTIARTVGRETDSDQVPEMASAKVDKASQTDTGVVDCDEPRRPDWAARVSKANDLTSA